MVFAEMELRSKSLSSEALFKILTENSGRNSNEYVLTNFSNRQEVWDWCEQNDIHIEYQGSLYSRYDVWYISDESHRMWFKLRWE